MRISDWSSDVCSSDLQKHAAPIDLVAHFCPPRCWSKKFAITRYASIDSGMSGQTKNACGKPSKRNSSLVRSEEHTSELQSLMRNSYAVFCLKKKNKRKLISQTIIQVTKNTNDKIKKQQNN